MAKTILSAENITKVYPNGVVANRNVNFSVVEGEIHAIIGENGAGKSTLMKILFGAEQPETGQIVLNGQPIEMSSPKVAIANGIGMVHQHFMLVPSLTVAENVMLGNEPLKNGLFYDKNKARKLVEEHAQRAGFNLNIDAVIDDISIGMKQKTEILKALVRGAKILILDEPTAVLTPQETKELFVQLLNLKEQGHTIIFISHKLNEIMDICDRVTIMHHCTTEGVYSTKEITPEEISRKMVGREVVLKIPKESANPGAPLLEISKLSYVNATGKKMLNNVSMKLRGGEILGVAGVEGNGQSELAAILSGIAQPNTGSIRVLGEEFHRVSPRGLRDKNVSCIPEDRMIRGSAPALSICENLFADRIGAGGKEDKVFLNRQWMNQRSQELVKDFGIKCDNIHQHVQMLSGGNIQKVVAAREMASDVQILIAEQPTRGIDVGAAELLRRKIIEMRDKGVAILLISADLNEILEISDSVIVMYGGEISAYFPTTETLTEEELGFYMLGVKKQSAEEWRQIL